MKINSFSVDTKSLKINQLSLSNTILMAFHQEDSPLFEILDYDNDFIFLEPSLFYYFLSDIRKEDKMPLIQSMLGYISEEKRLRSVSLITDRFHLVNLPNLGYIRSKSQEQVSIETLNQILIPNEFIKNSQIRLCLQPTDLLANHEGIVFHESIEVTLAKNKNALVLATGFFQNYLPDFWNLIKSVTREFVVFSSPNHNSFAGIMHHGTAYFNAENKIQTPIFFIDDIAHQCGHIIFNALTLDTPKYLRVPKDHPLKNYSTNHVEMRGAYGAFHGLFTYNCILHALDEVLQSLCFTDATLRFEALGRIGFYLHKFYMDLKLMDNPEILTEAGLNFHRQFNDGFQITLAQYKKEIQGFNYSNQPYTFQYDLFQKLNPLSLYHQTNN